MSLLDQASQVRPGEELNAHAVETFVKDHVPGLQGSCKITQFPGGAANLTYLLEFADHAFVLYR